VNTRFSDWQRAGARVKDLNWAVREICRAYGHAPPGPSGTGVLTDILKELMDSELSHYYMDDKEQPEPAPLVRKHGKPDEEERESDCQLTGRQYDSIEALMKGEGVPQAIQDRVAEYQKATEDFAGHLYEGYCNAVGGVAFNGDPLPSWQEFRADETKKKQSNAWVIVAILAEDRCGLRTQPAKL